MDCVLFIFCQLFYLLEHTSLVIQEQRSQEGKYEEKRRDFNIYILKKKDEDP